MIETPYHLIIYKLQLNFILSLLYFLYWIFFSKYGFALFSFYEWFILFFILNHLFLNAISNIILPFLKLNLSFHWLIFNSKVWFWCLKIWWSINLLIRMKGFVFLKRFFYFWRFFRRFFIGNSFYFFILFL